MCVCMCEWLRVRLMQRVLPASAPQDGTAAAEAEAAAQAEVGRACRLGTVQPWMLSCIFKAPSELC